MRRVAALVTLLAATGGVLACGKASPAPKPVRVTAAVAAFDAPQQTHAVYARASVNRTITEMGPLIQALRQQRRRRARSAWRAAWSQYLVAGVSYGAPAGLDEAIDGTLDNGGEVTGFHLLEQTLWQNGDLLGAVPVATTLQRNLIQLRRAVSTVKLTPLAYAQRPHELLHDAQANLITERAVPWSHDGVEGVAGDTAAAAEVLRTLYPLMTARGVDPAPIKAAIKSLDDQLAAILRTHRHSRYPTLDKLQGDELAQLTAGLRGAVNATANLPKQLRAAPV